MVTHFHVWGAWRPLRGDGCVACGAGSVGELFAGEGISAVKAFVEGGCVGQVDDGDKWFGGVFVRSGVEPRPFCVVGDWFGGHGVALRFLILPVILSKSSSGGALRTLLRDRVNVVLAGCGLGVLVVV